MGTTKALSNNTDENANANPDPQKGKTRDQEDRKATLESLTLEQLQRYTPNENRRMLKNVFVASFGFLFLFTAFNSISTLQSSIHSEDGLGTIGSSTIYGGLIFSSLFVPTYLIRRLTTKWTLVISMSGYMLYMGAQFYPSFATIIPTAIVVGLAGAPLWASKSFYLTHIANKYSHFTRDDPEVIIVRFFGIFFCIFQNSQIWGNLLSSLILSSGQSNWTPNETQLARCGADFCPGDLFTEEDDEKSAELKRKINIFCGVCVALGVLAIVFTTLLLDPLGRYGEKERLEEESQKMSTSDQVAATFRQMKRPYQLLLIPLTIFSGLEQSFFGGDFTQAYVTCSWGVQHVGYVFICYGVVDATLSAAFGPLLRRIGRLPIFILGTLINVGVIVVYFVWKPNPDTPVIYYVIAGFWGAADAVWQTQINALYGFIFPDAEEAAFSNYRFWESVGFIIGYANNNISCIRPKLYILIGFLAIGMSCYLVIEVLERRKRLNGAQNEKSKT